jgi:lipopolysaccharide/colanic/teichoic acid biosynthesis glycosyltransferase
VNVARESLKVGVEWCVAAAGLALVSPLLATLCGVVAATSRGGPFYVSQRIGRHGRIFGCIKLRTMKVGAPMVVDADAKTVVEEKDERLTVVGRFLRHGLDELPQVINVLKGDMGLIGPRPDAAWMLPRYTETIRRRLQIRPGISGLAQVLDSRQGLTTAQGYAVDNWYITNHHLALDLWILYATAMYLLGEKNVGDRWRKRLQASGVLHADVFQPLPQQRLSAVRTDVST